MQLDLSYFIVNQHHVLSLTDETTYQEFKDWLPMHGDYIRLPWGDLLCDLESYVVDKEEFEAQEEVFSDCSLNIQNLIYNLKQIQLKDNPDSEADLVFQ